MEETETPDEVAAELARKEQEEIFKKGIEVGNLPLAEGQNAVIEFKNKGNSHVTIITKPDALIIRIE